MKQLSIILLSLLLLSACKYEDGPGISFRTKKNRAVNTWYLEKVLENGADKTNNYKTAFVDYKLNIKDDKTYMLTYRAYNITNYVESGDWAFTSDKVNIDFTKVGGGPNRFKILRLKAHEFWIVQTTNGTEVEIHLKD